MTVDATWLWLSTVLLLCGMLFAWSLFRLLKTGPPIPITPPRPDAPLISVIIPARNEARNIRRCVDQLLAQSYRSFELIVINDHSTDDTLAILEEMAARDTRLRVIQSEALPPGWKGKPHALVQGVRESRGDWLCFIDADTFAGPELLASTLCEAQVCHSDLLSIYTKQELGSFWEKVICPVAFTGFFLFYNLERINDPAHPDATSIGQFILIRRAVYEAIGGHHAVRDTFLDDRFLAERAKQAGHHIRLADGQALARTRMHTSLREIWESWVRTIYPGMRDQPAAPFLLAPGLILSTLVYCIWPIGALFSLAAGGGLAAFLILIEACVFWACFLMVRAASVQSYGISRFYAFLTPLGMILFCAMILDSAYRGITGRDFAWKGRTYLAE
jgi:chlorobactene glucosyltransferase